MTSLNNFQIRSLINIANFKSGILKENFVLSSSKLNFFDGIQNGIPLLIEADRNIFEYDENDVFSVSPDKLVKLIYNTTDKNYVGFKNTFENNLFLKNINIKKKYLDIYEKFYRNNISIIEKVKTLKLEHNKLGAFQTRNIPHKGHERIIRELLKNCSHVVINPVIGPKKKGDINLEILEDIFGLINTRYENNLSFLPVYANMFYAGPREAIHHSIIRENIGFDVFAIGRDHAGAENLYKPDDAINTVKKYSHLFKLKIICHGGALYCSKCGSTILKNECKHDTEYYREISGTEFRKYLNSKRIYNYCDLDIQNYIHTCNKKVFL